MEVFIEKSLQEIIPQIKRLTTIAIFSLLWQLASKTESPFEVSRGSTRNSRGKIEQFEGCAEKTTAAASSGKR